MSPEKIAAIAKRVADAAAELLSSGDEGTTVEVPELGETWTISREPSS